MDERPGVPVTLDAGAYWTLYRRRMALKLCELLSIVLLMIVGGLYWGPWVALTRSMVTFEPEVFLAIVKRMNHNMEIALGHPSKE